MVELLNGYSADGAGAELVVLAGGVLEAVVEVLTPGPGLGAGVRHGRPVPFLLETVPKIGIEHRLLGARRQIAALLLGPFHLLFPAGRLGLGRRKENQVMPGAPLEDETGIELALGELGHGENGGEDGCGGGGGGAWFFPSLWLLR